MQVTCVETSIGNRSKAVSHNTALPLGGTGTANPANPSTGSPGLNVNAPCALLSARLPAASIRRMRTTSRKARSVLALAAATLVLVPVASTPAAASDRHRDFDLQAHRGGMAYRPETTLASFGNGLRLGVSTLELDIQVTRGRGGGNPRPQGRRQQVRRHRADQLAVPGSRMPTLREVFALARRYRADDVRFNVETKVEAGAPDKTAPREQFVQLAVREMRAAGLVDRVNDPELRLGRADAHAPGGAAARAGRPGRAELPGDG
jgi:glycerophosphoryl diester phosphodiesterase family protein